jgi:hypothetical protein
MDKPRVRFGLEKPLQNAAFAGMPRSLAIIFHEFTLQFCVFGFNQNGTIDENNCRNAAITVVHAFYVGPIGLTGINVVPVKNDMVFV